MKTDGYLSFIKPLERLITKKVLQVNPTIAPLRQEPEKTIIFVYEYERDEVDCRQLNSENNTYLFAFYRNIIFVQVKHIKQTINQVIQFIHFRALPRT